MAPVFRMFSRFTDNRSFISLEPSLSLGTSLRYLVACDALLSETHTARTNNYE